MRASYTSRCGVIRSEWRREKGAFTLKVSVPVNSSASVFLPETQGATITEGGRPVTIARREGGASVIELGSRDYELIAR